MPTMGSMRSVTPPLPLSSRKLHIAMVAPPYFSIPPAGYGGIESVVADLVDALVGRGHEITLIGAGSHGTRAQRFLKTYDTPPAERLGEPIPEVVHAAKAAALLEQVGADIIHDHTTAGPLLARGRLTPTVVTAHGSVTGDHGEYYRALTGTVGLVAISAAQRSVAPDLPWTATVHNAIRATTFPFRSQKESFALFLGRIHPEKAPHTAIDAARAAGMKIILAGKCTEPIERAYFASHVQPRLGPDAVLYGVADATAKRDLLSRAACLLFPIDWHEPFGLVLIEAMACGTPVVATRRGAVPELVVDEQTGIIVDEPGELVDAIRRARRLDPAVCRKHVESNFSVEVMAAGYESVYRRVLATATVPALLLGRQPLTAN